MVNGDNAIIRKMALEFPKKTTLLYGMDSDSADLDARMFDINYGEEGTSFKISFKGEVHEGFTRLLGRPMLENKSWVRLPWLARWGTSEVALA
ncbi:MAG: hypothetical protein R3D26_15125 [Cyanobacteriota/Melainabacteria group bacterium]